ncbi:MAG: exo-alpha-sialidase [Clostridia bacterium]|nr:exo-alpha-sialidase [Clostridia bacterium]
MKVTSLKYLDARSDGFSEWHSRKYTDKDGLTLIERKRLQSESDFTNGLFERTSTDNGKSWSDWTDITGEAVMAYGAHERTLPEADTSEVHPQWNAVHGHSVSIAMDRVFKNGHEAAFAAFWGRRGEGGFSDHTYLVIQKTDGSKCVQLVKYEDGAEFDPEDPVAPGYFCKNTGYRGMNVVVEENGDIILLICPSVTKCCELGGMNAEEIFPSCPDIMHGILMIRGKWNGERYEFEPSRPIVISDRLSSRGVDEATVARLDSGRILIVFRGSNVRSESWNTRIEPGAPGFKWYCFSDDGGKTFSSPAPWRFDDGEAIYSSASISYLFRGEKNGRLYWIGNITDHKVCGNYPRWPLCLVEVDETFGTAKKETLTVIDTIREGESKQVQLSNFSFWQNRETEKLELFVTKIGQFEGETVWKSEVWHYEVGLEQTFIQ